MRAEYFHQGQIERSHAVLPMPTKSTLVNNRSDNSFPYLRLDLAISRIIEPKSFACSLNQPSVEVTKCW